MTCLEHEHPPANAFEAIRRIEHQIREVVELLDLLDDAEDTTESGETETSDALGIGHG